MCKRRILGKPFAHYAYPRADTSRPWSRKSQRRKEPVLWNEIPFFLQNSTKWKTHPHERTSAIELLLFHERREQTGEKDIENTHCKTSRKTSYSASLFDRLAYQMNKSSTDFSTFLTSLFNKLIFQNLYGLDRDSQREISHEIVEFAMNLKSY